jgi:hypothetical protein
MGYLSRRHGAQRQYSPPAERAQGAPSGRPPLSAAVQLERLEDLRLVDLRLVDLRLEDLPLDALGLEDLLFFGTLPPARRASDRPIATACLRLLTFLPELPLRSSPRFISCIARSTFSDAFFPYLAMARS